MAKKESRKERRGGISGLDIILIVVVVAATVFYFAVLSAGTFSTQKVEIELAEGEYGTVFATSDVPCTVHVSDSGLTCTITCDFSQGDITVGLKR